MFDPNPPLKNKCFFSPIQYIIASYNTSLKHLSKSSGIVLNRYSSISPSSLQKVIKSLDIINDLFLYYESYCSLYHLYSSYNREMTIAKNRLELNKITLEEYNVIICNIDNSYKELISTYGDK